MNPKISVVMSAYNADKYLRECIESILNQTFTDFEFVIVNDCSTDKTSEILNFYSDKDSRIKIINNTKNNTLMSSSDKRLSIMSDLEEFAFYGFPDFDDQQRLNYFVFTPEEWEVILHGSSMY